MSKRFLAVVAALLFLVSGSLAVSTSVLAQKVLGHYATIGYWDIRCLHLNAGLGYAQEENAQLRAQLAAHEGETP